VLTARGTRNGKTYDDRLVIHLTYRPSRLADASVPFHELGVNVGSRAQVADAADLVWEGDQPYRAGGFGYTGGSARMFNKDLAITGHALTPLFFTYREGIESYRLDVPDGTYDLELLFAEPGAQPGERVFDVVVNGQTMLSALDLAAQHGVARAATYTMRVAVTNGQGIVATFRPLKGEPILNAIHVVKR